MAGMAEMIVKIDAKPDQKFYKAKPVGKKSRKLAAFSGNDSISGVVEINLKNDEPY